MIDDKKASEKLAWLTKQRALADAAIASGNLDQLFAMTSLELGQKGTFFKRTAPAGPAEITKDSALTKTG